MGHRGERAQAMATERAVFQQIMGAVLCLSLVVWSVLPSFTHAPTVFETIQDHLLMVEDHGHSHWFEEDLYWAMHGHSHDVPDHDHNQAFLTPSRSSEPSAGHCQNNLA